MKSSSIIYSGILIATFVVSGLGQQPTIPDKNKSEGTVDADKDRAGKTGHIGDGDRGGSDKIRYVGSERAFEHSQLIKTGVFLKTSLNKHSGEWIRTTMVICHLRNFARRDRVL